MAAEGRIIAIGECGLDRHYLTVRSVCSVRCAYVLMIIQFMCVTNRYMHAWQDHTSMAEQERVLRRLCEVAKVHDLPLILHSRKAEARVFEILQVCRRLFEWHNTLALCILASCRYIKQVCVLSLPCVRRAGDAGGARRFPLFRRQSRTCEKDRRCRWTLFPLRYTRFDQLSQATTCRYHPL
jgi:hypothetical protein